MPEPTDPPRPREIVAWAMFDFANSSYTTVVVTVAFSVYFTRLVAPPGRGDFLWGLGLAMANLVVLLLSPIVGAIADDSGRKKAFLFATYALCVAGTAALWLVVPGRAGLGVALLVVSFVGFSFGENLAGAFLPEISTPENVGRISGFGWGLGYFGGLGSLLLVQPLLRGGFEAENLGNLRLAWVATALFFLLAGLPTFLFLRERAPRRARRALEYVRAGFRRLAATAAEVRRFSELAQFLAVYFVYYAGLTTVVAFAGIYAVESLGFTFGELTTLFLMLQLSAAAGAFLFGWVQDRFGAVRTIRIALGIWILVCLGAYACVPGREVAGLDGKQLFWGVALFAGLGIGSLQSASRALVGLFAPVQKAGEFFGFWGLAGKAAYMVGPFVFGAISAASSQRVAMLSTAGFFVLGLAGMAWVDEARGRRVAEEWEREAAVGAGGAAAA
ncbi:MAG TPA: MFS transporter [Thermoanaerobaculia bacterium]|nr:MFS transporter [Thermoanaerobaculia bacterium]